MLAWSLWNNRNDLVWNGKSKPNGVLIESAQGDLSHWKMATAVKNVKVQTIGDATTKTWRKPDIGWLKCNVDAAVVPQ